MKRSPINRRSKKTEEKYKERRALVARLLAERPFCEACPVFARHDEVVVYRANRSADIHELVRRSRGGSILDEKNLLAVCRKCHRRIGENPMLSESLGLELPSWGDFFDEAEQLRTKGGSPSWFD